MLELAAEGDAAAQRLLGDAGRALGVAIANLCNILNPACVIVGGDLSGAGDVLLEPLRDEVRRNAIPSAVQDLAIVAGVLGERAEMLGALALVMRRSDRFSPSEPLMEAA
jgi:predicted NBD/HSP70 family sugar kinase